MMSPTSTLEYGYSTGRHDPPTAVVPSDQPPARNVAPTKDEGRQAEKVIKGMFTGSFNFEVNIVAPANKTVLKLTGSIGSGASVARYALDINYQITSGLADVNVIRVTTSTFPSGSQYLLTWHYSGEIRFRIDAWGRVRGGSNNIVQVLNPVFTFNAATNSGIGLDTSGSGATQLWANELVCDVHRVGSSITQMRFASNNTTGDPHVTHTLTSGSGLWFNSEAAGRYKVMLRGDTLGGQVSCYNGTVNAGESRAAVKIDAQLTRATSGTHARFNLLELDIMDDGAQNAGLVTDTTTLYIAGAPDTDTQDKITNFRAIWVRFTTGGGGGFSGGSGGFVDLEGDLRVTGRIAFRRGDVGATIRSIQFGNGLNIVKAGSGNHPQLNLLELDSFTANGIATHTDATTLYLVGAPNTTTSGGGLNRAIWVRSGAGGGLVEFEGLFRVTSTFTPAVGVSGALVSMAGTLTEQTSGNHPRLSLVEFAALGVTAGAATVTDATTVYIAGPPTATVTGKNRALWVVGGEAEFGGQVSVNGVLVIGSGSVVTDRAMYLTGASVSSGGTVQTGFTLNPQMQSTCTTEYATIRAQFTTPATAFTMTAGKIILVQAPAIGAGSAVTTLYGLYINDLTQGGTNYAIYTNAGLVRFGGQVDGFGEVNTFGVSAATGARLRLRYFYTASPADPPANMADLMIVDTGAATVFRVRYNDASAGAMKVGDLALV